ASLVRDRPEQLDGEAAALGVAGQGAEEISGPQRRLVAADALADLDDHVLGVSGICFDQRELQLLLERRQPLLELRDELAEIAVFASVFEIGLRLAPALREPVRALQ